MSQQIRKEDRKITSDKFTITIPKDWRDSHGLTPKMALSPFYQEGSPLVLIPSDMELDDLETQLVTLLVKYKSIKDSYRLAKDLGNIVDLLNEGNTVA
jgi:hypothetical protein